MYDQETDSYWNQLTGQAIVGTLTGKTLERVPIIPTTWGDWKAKHPDTLLLSEGTGVKGNRDYSYNPYLSYFNSPEETFGTKKDDRRLLPKELVFPVTIGEGSKVYSNERVKDAKLIIDNVGGEDIVVVWDESLETVRIFFTEGKDVSDYTIEQLEELKPYETFITYWFSWVAFNPETQVYL